MNDNFERDGFMILSGVFDRAECQRWIDLLGPAGGAGRRGLLRHSAVAEFARSESVIRLVRPHLVCEPVAVRAIFFDKTPSQNWLVAWHQDLSLALAGSTGAPGFGPWSVKDGIPHALAPADFLAQMVTLRLHLDDCDEASGALRVIPGSHRRGRLGAAEIQALRGECTETVCTLAAGSALLMRPLLLHASGRSTSPRHRRVLHIEYAAFSLPAELQWNEAA